MTATTLAPEIESTTLLISDIHCLHCAACLEGTIADVAGVLEAVLDGGMLTLSYRPAILRLADLIEAMHGLGLRVVGDPMEERKERVS